MISTSTAAKNSLLKFFNQSGPDTWVVSPSTAARFILVYFQVFWPQNAGAVVHAKRVTATAVLHTKSELNMGGVRKRLRQPVLRILPAVRECVLCHLCDAASACCFAQKPRTSSPACMCHTAVFCSPQAEAGVFQLAAEPLSCLSTLEPI